MKQLLIVATALVALAGCTETAPPAAVPAQEGFAIYLLAGEGPPSLLEETELDELVLAETPVIGPEDLVAYDAATHTMSLSVEAYERVRELFAAGAVPFVVTVDGERIYSGVFVSPLLSRSFDSVVMLDPLALDPPRLQLSLGYPGPVVFTGEDPRADPRILAAVGGE
jgi:hypothetical protein